MWSRCRASDTKRAAVTINEPQCSVLIAVLVGLVLILILVLQGFVLVLVLVVPVLVNIVTRHWLAAYHTVWNSEVKT